MNLSMTDDEYRFMTGDHTGDTFYDSGMSCYENGWVDPLGFVTPKGEKAMKEYEDG